MFRLYPRGDTGDKGDPDFVGVFVELVSRAPEDMEKDIKVVLRWVKARLVMVSLVLCFVFFCFFLIRHLAIVFITRCD